MLVKMPGLNRMLQGKFISVSSFLKAGFNIPAFFGTSCKGESLECLEELLAMQVISNFHGVNKTVIVTTVRYHADRDSYSWFLKIIVLPKPINYLPDN